jgi:hypothetical protein
MNLTAKAAVLALIVLLSFSASMTTTYADDRDGNQFSNGENGGDDTDERKKPKFQTKFFSEE